MTRNIVYFDQWTSALQIVRWTSLLVEIIFFSILTAFPVTNVKKRKSPIYTKTVMMCIVSRFYRVLYVFFVSNWHIRSRLLTDYYSPCERRALWVYFFSQICYHNSWSNIITIQCSQKRLWNEKKLLPFGIEITVYLAF